MRARSLVSLAAALWFLAVVPGLWAKEAKAEFNVSGMTCGMCAKGVEAQLKKLEGVKSATVSYRDGSAEVVYDDAKLTPEKIKETIEKSGFKAELKQEGKSEGSAAKPAKKSCCP